MDNLKEISEGITSLLGLIGIISFGYMLIMGIVHKASRTYWFGKEKERRLLQGKPNITLSSSNVKTELPWKDPGLLQGGFTALQIIGFLLVYVAGALIVPFLPNLLYTEDLTKMIAFTMALPVSMGAWGVYVFTRRTVHRYKLEINFLTLFYSINLACVFWSWFPIFVEIGQRGLVLQIYMLAIVSICISIVAGMIEGIKGADVETRFPLVNVVTTQGITIKQLRLYENTDTDYRFIGKDGVNFILPSLHIAEIKHLPEKTNDNLSGLQN